MKKKILTTRKILFVLTNCFLGFTAFLFVVLLGELLSGSFNYSYEFNFEAIHFQIALLGGILQGSLYLFKSPGKTT